MKTKKVDITLGERNEDGTAPVFINGEKTKVVMTVWGDEDLNNCQRIAKRLRKKNK